MRRGWVLGFVVTVSALGGCASSSVSGSGDAAGGETASGEGGRVDEDAREADASHEGDAAALDEGAGADVAVADTAPSLDASAADAPAASDAGPAPDAPLLPDAGPLGDPPWAPIEVRTATACPRLMACGGDVAGVWDVSGGCVDVLIEDTVRMCPTARIVSATGRARGRVLFADRIATRRAEYEVEVSLFVPALCAALVGRCEGLQSLLRSAAPNTTCVTEGRGDCACTSRESGRISDGDLYETTATQIVSSTSGKRWDYCVAGTTLRYADRSASPPREPGTIQLTRRGP